MKPCRSALFVPGNRPSWMEKAAAYGADALILDLEDAVPLSEKGTARAMTRSVIPALASQGQVVSVRVNGLRTGLFEDDLFGVACGELFAIVLPKVESVQDLQQLDLWLTKWESSAGVPHGQIETPLICETAQAMRQIYEIATACPRVKQATLAAGPGGDAARAIGYQWSKAGTETLYLRSKAVLDCRAAGIAYPTISSWWNIQDLEGLEQDARWNRQLGFRGMAVMHPTHVPIVNRVFTPSAEEIAYYRGMIEALDAAKSQGIAAVTYQGEMVDEAMARTAREILEFATAIGVVN